MRSTQNLIDDGSLEKIYIENMYTYCTLARDEGPLKHILSINIYIVGPVRP